MSRERRPGRRRRGPWQRRISQTLVGGPITAGVLRGDRARFQLFGDTVNTAARIEQAGEGGKINISEAVYEVVGEAFNCTPRGKIAIKNKAPQEMYFVTINDE